MVKLRIYICICIYMHVYIYMYACINAILQNPREQFLPESPHNYRVYVHTNHCNKSFTSDILFFSVLYLQLLQQHKSCRRSLVKTCEWMHTYMHAHNPTLHMLPHVFTHAMHFTAMPRNLPTSTSEGSQVCCRLVYHLFLPTHNGWHLVRSVCRWKEIATMLVPAFFCMSLRSISG